MEYIDRRQHCTVSFSRSVPDLWAWVCLEWPGLDSIVCVLALDVSVRPCTNGVSLLSRNVSVVPLIRLLATLSYSVPHTANIIVEEVILIFAYLNLNYLFSFQCQQTKIFVIITNRPKIDSI